MTMEDSTNQVSSEQSARDLNLQPLLIQEIQQLIPHRFPFLLVDQIIEDDHLARRAVGIKAVSINEPFFQGHFPNYPIMPGVLIAEALAQVCAVSLQRRQGYKGHMVFLAGLEKFRFRSQVVPGDTLRLEITFVSLTQDFGRAVGKALVKTVTVAEGELLFAVSRQQSPLV